MKIGYSFWGFTSDYKLRNNEEVSSPDGCFLYVWSIFQELVKRGHQVYRMMPDQDDEAVKKHGRDAFSLFSKDKRYLAYHQVMQADLNNLPDLDILFLEWRWPVDGKNINVGQNKKDPDLDIHNYLLDYYSKTKTVVIGSDQDYKMTRDDISKVDVVFDWGFKHGWHVDVPFDWSEISQFSTLDSYRHPILYVGSRYERDDYIDKYIYPLAEKQIEVVLIGNWLERNRDSMEKWPLIKFSDKRVTNFEFKDLISNTLVSPLLAKKDYNQYGLMTGRLIECLLFGAMPVGFKDFWGIDKYLPNELIVDSSESLFNLILRPQDRSQIS